MASVRPRGGWADAGPDVGVDFSQATVERAPSVVAVLDIGNFEVVTGDVPRKPL